MKNIALLLILSALPLLVNAAGFALSEQSGSGLGNAFAGASASAEDASTIFFNPAGMTYIEGTQLVGVINAINPNVDFNNQGSVAGAGNPLGGNGGNAGSLTFIPNFYFKTDLPHDIKFGLGVNTPFGLTTEYNSDWVGRYQAIKSSVKTVNINPALAFKASDKLSLGAGFSAIWTQAELTNAVNLGSFGEAGAKVKGDDWGFGFNLGAIYQLTPDSRLGLAYRSKVEQHLTGDVSFTRPAGALPAPILAATANGAIAADLTLPETLSLSGFSQINDKLDLLADVTWTRWSQFKDLTINHSSGTLLSTVPENWNNTMRYSVGANYHYSDAIKLRGGLAYDKEAISDQFRTARIPGNDRKWLALGAGFKLTPKDNLDVGYAHLFVSEADINSNLGAAKGALIGAFDSNVDIISMQITHQF